ncbi:MAG: hypothetical protein IPF99_32840 [Deltaproteobacteria bacterium]|nr:hypothetical protein [Deltaproteobacteria bacterium]
MSERVIAALWEVAFESNLYLPDVLWMAENRGRAPGALGTLMRRSFPVDAILRRVGTGFWLGAESCKNLLAATPPDYRVALAQALLKNDARRAEVVSVLLEHPETFLELLVEIAPLLPEAPGREVAQSLWRHAPDRAEELARAAWVDHGESSPWMDGATMEHRLRLVRIFLSHTERPVPEPFLRWLARSIPELGAEADRVFELMQAQGWSRLAFEAPPAVAPPIVGPSTRRRS